RGTNRLSKIESILVDLDVPKSFMRSKTRLFDPNLLEAAQDLGAGEWRTFRWIILPLVTPAILSGWLLSFTLSLDDVIISSFVTGSDYEILPVRVYSMVKVGISPEVNVLATLLLALSLVLVTIVSVLTHRRNPQS
ncbi:MAG: ABC transporter permease subunit, partial [Candidatus Thiodiazotropha sp.]